jgi:hypothetical protein
VGRGGDVAVVGESLVGIVEEEDIFGLQIGMDEVEVVKEGYTGKELPCKALNLTARKRDEGIRLEEVENALP